MRHDKWDHLASEAPLEIRVGLDRSPGIPWTVTMRTPGHDFELIVGHLMTEGVLRGDEKPLELKKCQSKTPGADIVFVKLEQSCLSRIELNSRASTMNSSCGLCGKTSLDALSESQFLNPFPFVWDVDVLMKNVELFSTLLPDFGRTGGTHGCAYFDELQTPVLVYEDVGRHNALDKLIGASKIKDICISGGGFLVLSGRVSFEMVHKAAMAKIGTIVAIGAPTDLAIELAQKHRINLIGFCRGDKCNIYNLNGSK